MINHNNKVFIYYDRLIDF